jgi:hypothetical protein
MSLFMALKKRRVAWFLCLMVGGFTWETLATPLVFSLVAQEEAGEKSDQPDVAESISALKTKLRQEVADLKDLYLDAEDEKTRQGIVADRRALEEKIVAQVIQLTGQRNDDSQNIRDLVWFFNQSKGVARTNVGTELLSRYLHSDELTEFAMALDRVPSPSAENEKWMQDLMEKSPHAKVQARATVVLGGYLEKLQQEIAAIVADGRDVSGYLKLRTNDELTMEIESLLTRCIEKYPDIKIGREKIGNIAAAKLTKMNLRVGKVAPDIVGVDLDDVEFKLSDYRGKVVVIDFWGDW